MNESGIHPVGKKVLIEPDELEEVSEGGIVIPKTALKQHEYAQSIGRVMEIGPDCWYYEFEKNASGDVIKTIGYSKAQFEVGDRVCYTKYAGIQMPGKDGKDYRVVNIGDVTARVEEGVDFTDFKPRKPLGELHE